MFDIRVRFSQSWALTSSRCLAAKQTSSQGQPAHLPGEEEPRWGEEKLRPVLPYAADFLLTCSSVYMCVKSKLCLVPPRPPPQMTGPTTSRPRTRPSVRCKYEQAWPELPGFALLRALMVWCFLAGCRCCRIARRRRWTRRSKETRTRVRTTSSRSWPSPLWERWRRGLETTAAATVELQVRIIQKSLSNKHHSWKETKFKD